MSTPFFILGSGRSGTTYLYHLLAAHPQVALTNEARLLDALCLSYRVVTLPAGERDPGTGLRGVVRDDAIGPFSEIFIRHARRMLEEYYAAAFTKPFTHWGDKLPNADCALAARVILPDARFLLQARDPRDVICSYRSFVARRPESDFAAWIKDRPLADVCADWAGLYRRVLDQLAQYHLIRYEDLLAEPAAVVSAVLAFLDLPAHPAVAAAIAGNNTFAGQATSASPAASHGRWRQELTPAEAAIVVDVCGDIMQRFDYLP